MKCILGDWIILLRLLASRPTHVRELIQQKIASYKGWVDASYWGVAGVWFPANKDLEPFVWFVQWPEEIQNRLISDDNPNRSISISNLELAGILLEFLVLEDTLLIGSLKHRSINIWCDNITAVAWTPKLRTSTSPIVAQLLWALAIGLHKTESSLIGVNYISGIFNVMADVASCQHATNHLTFLRDFTSTFPPPQGYCWHNLQLHKMHTWKVFLLLLEKPLTMELWRQLSRKEGRTGSI